MSLGKYASLTGRDGGSFAGNRSRGKPIPHRRHQDRKPAYAAADGRPLAAPVWFIVDGGGIVFNTGKNSAKGSALARGPRATLCVDLEEPPYGFVQVQGVAELSEDLDEMLRAATAIAARYVGQDRAEKTGGATPSRAGWSDSAPPEWWPG
jgi:PPOX class probable F420-dependent enzyme